MIQFSGTSGKLLSFSLFYYRFDYGTTKGKKMESKRLEFGQVIIAEVFRNDGMGYKARPCIVLDDDEEIRVLCGTSRHATEGSLLPGEFLVHDQKEMEEMGLEKPTKFSWNSGDLRFLNHRALLNTIGDTPNGVLGEAFRAGKRVGAY